MQKSFRLYIIAASIITVLLADFLLRANPTYSAARQIVVDKITNKPKESEFNDLKWGWQNDVPWYHLAPVLKEASLIRATPKNWQGTGHETFATLYASRDAHMADPYFLAVQQIIYRVLWRPESRTNKHTMTVFVLPFISQQQRDYFTAAGALVKEVPEEVYHPDEPGAVPGRWRDMFSKLDMWSHTEYSRIAYLDSDAFPLRNIDSIFDHAEEQQCKNELFPDIDQESELCNYTFTGWYDGISVNAGVLVFNPDQLMFERLKRLTSNHTKFDKGEMEQSLLNYAFRQDGPTPYQDMPHAYNGGTNTENGDEEYVVHAKLWNMQFEPETRWYKNLFNETWSEMLEFYASDEFRSLRLEDDHEWTVD